MHYAAELGKDFPSFPVERLNALVRLSHPNKDSAHELAKAILNNPISRTRPEPPNIKIIPHYARPSLDSSPPNTPSKRPASSKLGLGLDHATSSFLAESHATTKSIAFGQAAEAYRKSRSAPLMGGAAAYYASVGRDASASSQAYASNAADLLADKQSTSHSVDLHGIDVKNAVRIAQVKVQRWWDGGQAEWARQGKVMGSGGYRIITGIGMHSEGGRAKLLPAVRKMLVNEGWRIDEEAGALTVTGRARR